jgi:hypothetical protein
MSASVAIITIAICLGAGTAYGKRRYARQLSRSAVDPSDIDDCPTVYADEKGCECMEDEVLNVECNERGQPVCKNCGRRRV